MRRFLARSVMIETVLPNFLLLCIFWLQELQVGFSIPEILFVIFLADVSGELVE